MKKFFLAFAVVAWSVSAQSAEKFSQETADDDVADVASSEPKNGLDAALAIVRGMPFHLELSLDLSSAAQQGAAYRNCLIRGPGYSEPRLTLSVGMEFDYHILAAWLHVGVPLDLQMQDRYQWQGLNLAPGVGLSTGLKWLYKPGTQSAYTGGIFMGYFTRRTAVRDFQAAQMSGHGVLVGLQARLRPLDSVVFNTSLSAGPEWFGTRIAETGQEINKSGVVVLASLGLGFTLRNEPAQGGFDQGLEFFKSKVAQGLDQANTLAGLAAKTGLALAGEALETSQASGTAVHEPSQASGTPVHEAQESGIEDDEEGEDETVIPKSVEEEPAALPESSFQPAPVEPPASQAAPYL